MRDSPIQRLLFQADLTVLSEALGVGGETKSAVEDRGRLHLGFVEHDIGVALKGKRLDVSASMA